MGLLGFNEGLMVLVVGVGRLWYLWDERARPSCGGVGMLSWALMW